MSGDLFKVQFVRSKTCFLFIPERWVRKLRDIKKLDDDSSIKVIHGSNKTAYFGWQQTNTQHDNIVGMNASVATNLGVKEGDLISLAICSSPPPLKRVEMCPLTPDDLEMIESSSGQLQSTLLDQVRVIWTEQLVTAWISNALPITLLVGKMEPDVTVGRLEPLTEVSIGDPINNRIQSMTNPQLESENSIDGLVKSGMALANSFMKAVKGESNQGRNDHSGLSIPTEKAQYIFRVHPLYSDVPGHGPLDAFIPSPLLSTLFQLSAYPKESIVCKVTKLICVPSGNKPTNEIRDSAGSDSQLSQDICSYIRLFTIGALPFVKECDYSSNSRCIFMSNNLRRTLNFEVGSRAVLSDFKFGHTASNLERVDLFPYHGLRCLDLGQSLLQYAHDMTNGLLLSNNMLLTIPSAKGYIDAEVQLTPSKLNYSIVYPHQLNERKILVRFEKRGGKELNHLSIHPFVPKNFQEQLYHSHLQTLVNQGVTSLKFTMGLHEFSDAVRVNDNLLIVGKSGCGKTSTASYLCNLLQGPPHFVHNTVFKCRPLKGKTVESLYKQLQSFVDDCVYHQPSILLIDDLECIAGVPEDQDQNSQASAYFNRVARMILQVLKSLQSNHFVGVIATAPSISQIAPTLIPPRGVHFFSTILELPELSKVDREGILVKLMNRKMMSKELREVKCLSSVQECAKKTEGYCCQDLADLVDKATLGACMREVLSSKVPILEECDLLQALSNCTPMQLRGVSLHKDAAFGWDDIGGLTEVKIELKEVFEWPAMYPELFQNAPLRQQSGLLLYGAPGTGKTMLAAAVARECGLNFISVKGPELLSKYIGASEEAVRNVFLKAQSAKPCILFFDEFDSLAPRRGHDNTGVTDRVVNQLLTQLDGVESLVGVWVLAATSRPDLLDPALLRPGRLDRSVLCPLPDERSRLDILKALSRKMNLDGNIDFSDIATETEGFTGADLQSILYTAQLKAVDITQSSIEDRINHRKEQVVFKVEQCHLDAALKSTRPSLTLQERNKYLNIFKKFGMSQESDIQALNETAQRATLA